MSERLNGRGHRPADVVRTRVLHAAVLVLLKQLCISTGIPEPVTSPHVPEFATAMR